MPVEYLAGYWWESHLPFLGMEIGVWGLKRSSLSYSSRDEIFFFTPSIYKATRETRDTRETGDTSMQMVGVNPTSNQGIFRNLEKTKEIRHLDKRRKLDIDNQAKSLRKFYIP